MFLKRKVIPFLKGEERKNTMKTKITYTVPKQIPLFEEKKDGKLKRYDQSSD